MSVINLPSKQAGSYMVELSLVAMVFAMLFVFSGDLTIKLGYQGKLDRLAYSMANIVRERTQLYDTDMALNQEQALTIGGIAESSLARTVAGFDPSLFGYVIESLQFDDEGVSTSAAFQSSQSACVLNGNISSLEHISKMTSWERRATLYRVTLCYETDNWFGSLFGGGFRTIQSDAITLGR
ncbi:tight adherence pilus pseudopilin TadF [Vibrio ponticus]|uniref:tight adherence pilus pseudopilin TadF n=1 Tax=Vibrio ponticus TaxID=265668 RepID=UPI00111510E8